MLKKTIMKYLKRTGLKPYQLADMAGVPRPTIYRYLKGEREIMLSTAEKLTRIVGK